MAVFHGNGVDMRDLTYKGLSGFKGSFDNITHTKTTVTNNDLVNKWIYRGYFTYEEVDHDSLDIIHYSVSGVITSIKYDNRFHITHPMPHQEDPTFGDWSVEDIRVNTRTISRIDGHDTARLFAGRDTLTGGDRADVLLGFAGDDRISALGGHDTLDGGDGEDLLDGGDGNDTYIIRGGGDRIIDSSGRDMVRSSVSFSIATLPFIESLALTGDGDVNGRGNSGANGLSGNSGANTLLGLGGNDRLQGGEDRDLLTGGTGDDRFIYKSASQSQDGAIDVIFDFDDAGNDVIDLANLYAGALRFVEARGFTAAGQVHVKQVGASVFVEANLDSDKNTAELSIRLASTKLVSITESDFIL